MKAFQRLRLVRERLFLRPLFGSDLFGSDEVPTGELTIKRPIETYTHFFGRRGEQTFFVLRHQFITSKPDRSAHRRK